MPRLNGYFASGAVGVADVAASFGDEAWGTADNDLSALNVERIAGLVATYIGAEYVRDPRMKEVAEIAHYAYVPLVVRTITNLARKHLLTPGRLPFAGRSGVFQSAPAQMPQMPVNPDITYGGGYRPFGSG